MHPDWFDWLNLVVTVLASLVPASLAIALWRSDRNESIRGRRDAATREFVHLLAVGDPVLVRFRDFTHFADVMGRGAIGLLLLISRYMEWDRDYEEPDESGRPREPRIDLSVDVTDAIRRWNMDPAYRADLTEAALANGEVYPEPEDNRIISPSTRRAAEDKILKDPAYRVWLAGTRLAPARIRWRRMRDRLARRKHSPNEPLNPLATKTYLEDEEIGGDHWLRERTTAD
ncbi:hypothetical protein [Nocardioides sp. zg-1230]|uniref:hypothetical protein n=1 Tax=Nocardioides sp. zg-1230 TaxID=2736601 RepID=UPI0015561124|nr:hypothetical protein [Nocardioides sp. zg-1230]NPC42941.1 hypothetical protein [Nocardioides sp. zg-1230]